MEVGSINVLLLSNQHIIGKESFNQRLSFVSLKIEVESQSEIKEWDSGVVGPTGPSPGGPVGKSTDLWARRVVMT